MDPIFLRNLNYFSGQNLPSNVAQPGAPSVPVVPRDPNDIALWDALAAQDLAASASTSNLASAQHAAAHPSYRHPNLQQPTPSTSKRHAPADPDPSISGQRQRGGHERKRTRTDGGTGAFEPVDSWLQFDDDEMDNGLGGSFEIDFSRRQNYPSGFGGYGRPTSRLNPLPTTPGLGTGLYANPTFKEEVFEFDDGALDNALSDDEDLFDSINLGEQLSTIDTQPPSEVPPREGLYSTPLSWEKPVPGLPMNPPFFGIGTPMLDPEQRRLLAIALNTGGSSSSGFGLGTGGDLESEPSSMGHLGSTTATANPSEISKAHDDEAFKTKGKGKEKEKEKGKEKEKEKEKGKEKEKDEPTETSTKGQKGQKAVGSAQEHSKEKAKAGDRTAHNDIERKYRTNLKVKIAELRDAIPSLRSLPEEGDEEGDGEDQSRGPSKVSKGTILLKATEYIQQLEKRNKAIMKEHQELSRRLQAFEQLLTSTTRQSFPMPTYSRTLFDPRGFC
ncbi:hypothetical protein SODALDRAFT_72824 [Sodiomyces alkalinus F11]|uniref:BHLH domain-containing protein n=1 Tax=Sodiomyces alkalinus (strain CBS 110278 / VKM F-3762 / F11) TaxID=1314773 RepID=A0A3N2PK22_SODAK|nr:hypothetical protein SODALDRAFT_72824 [Sodiomyces alkalinus F11]ROT34877.1 hypothetical protein SODALDRAFT_72824 [Sodiomyces alkalinus F11]